MSLRMRRSRRAPDGIWLKKMRLEELGNRTTHRPHRHHQNNEKHSYNEEASTSTDTSTH